MVVSLLSFAHMFRRTLPFLGNFNMKEGIVIVPITKKEAKDLEKQGFKYHGFNADLCKTVNGRHYWASEKSKVLAALDKMRSTHIK